MARPCRSGVAWTRPSAAASAAPASAARRGAVGAEASRSAAASAAARSASTSTTVSRSAPSAQQRVRDRRARAAGAEQHDASSARVGQPAVEALARSPVASVLWPIARPSREHDGVDRAERRGVGGRARRGASMHQLLARVRDVEPVEAGRGPRASSSPTASGASPSSSMSSSRYDVAQRRARRPRARAAAGLSDGADAGADQADE